MSTPARWGFNELAQTRWSVVQRARAAPPADARAALADLALNYWYPVYAYVRRCGYAPVIAQEIVQAFFARLRDRLVSNHRSPQGRFRDWLLASLRTFLAEDRHGSEVDDPLDVAPPLDELERRNHVDHPAYCSPEDAYQRGFALQMLAHGFVTLRAEAGQTGHLEMYDALAPYLARDPVPGQYEEIGRKLGIRPLALVLALKRLRQRFRELVQRDLANSVASAEEFDCEQRALLGALGGSA